MSEFEDILKKTTEARKDSQNLEEYADGLGKMIGIKINSIFEEHQLDLLALDEELRNKIKEAVREKFETSMTEVENYPKGTEL